MARAFASQADMAEKKITFSRLSEHAFAFTAEGDPNTGIVVGDDAVLVVDAQATPKMAHKVIEYIRKKQDVLFWTGEQILDWFLGAGPRAP